MDTGIIPRQPKTIFKECESLGTNQWLPLVHPRKSRFLCIGDADDNKRSKKSPSFFSAVSDNETIGHARVVL